MTPTPPLPDWLVNSDPPSFWVNVAIAVGTIGSAVLALVLALNAFRSQSQRDRSNEQERLERQAELQAVLVSVEVVASGALPGLPSRWQVIPRNSSPQPIWDVRISDFSGAIVGEPGQMGPHSDLLFYLDRAAGAPLPGVAVSFTDSYQRKWVVDTDARLTQQGVRVIAAEPSDAE